LKVLPFVADAVSCAVSVVSLLWVRVPFKAGRTLRVRRSPGSEIVEAWRWLLGHPRLRILIWLMGGLMLCSFGTPPPVSDYPRRTTEPARWPLPTPVSRPCTG